MVKNSYIFQNGKNNNFIIFNPLNLKLKNEKIKEFEEIRLNKSDFWNKIKSFIWSSNCKIGFVINELNIIIINVSDDKSFKSNLTYKVIEEFLNTFDRQ